MSDSIWSDAGKLRELVAESVSVIEVLRKLKMKTNGSDYKTFYIYVKKYGISIDHFTGQSVKPRLTNKTAAPLEFYLVIDSAKPAGAFKDRLVKAALLEYRCYMCGIVDWLGQPLSLQIDHINGVNTDNRIDNLRLLCPNCHSQTPTFGSRNCNLTPSQRQEVRKRANEDVALLALEFGVPHRVIVSALRSSKCADCTKTIEYNRYRCDECHSIYRHRTKYSWPPVDDVVKLVKDTNFRQASKVLGVADNTIRKFFKRNGINPKTLQKGDVGGSTPLWST